MAFIVLPLEPARHVPRCGKCRCRYLSLAEVQCHDSSLSRVQLLLPVLWHKTSEVSSRLKLRVQYSPNTTVVGHRQEFSHKNFRQESFSTWKRRLCLRIVYMAIFILAHSVQVISRSQSSHFLFRHQSPSEIMSKFFLEQPEHFIKMI